MKDLNEWGRNISLTIFLVWLLFLVIEYVRELLK